MLNLSVVLEDSARETPDRDALVFGDLRLLVRLREHHREPGGEPAAVARRRPGRQGRARLPEPAVLPDRLLRHPQGRRRPSCR